MLAHLYLNSVSWISYNHSTTLLRLLGKMSEMMPREIGFRLEMVAIGFFVLWKDITCSERLAIQDTKSMGTDGISSYLVK